MSSIPAENSLYGFTSPLTPSPFPPIAAKRAPLTNDYYPIGQEWVDVPANQVYFLTSIVSNVANWLNVGGGAGMFNVINLPNTNAAETQGVIFFGGNRFISDFGTNNTFVGADSGNSTLTSINNTAVGTFAGSQLTSGGHNTFVGQSAGGGTTSGARNCAFGNGALINNTSGSDNTAIGEEALFENTDTNQSTAVGSSALIVATAGSLTAVGYQALLSNTTGVRNTAIGWNAIAANITSNDNTALGYAALELCTSENNTAIGSDALSELLTGTSNIAIGDNAGLNYTTDESNNIVIGNVGEAGESSVIRIGTTGTQTEAFIAGNVIASDSLYTAADGGAGAGAGTLGITPVVNTTQGAGTLSIKSTDGNNGNNTGFIKIYVGNTIAYLPYFTNIAP